MSWKDFLIPFHIFKTGKPDAKKDPYQGLLDQLKPYLDANREITQKAGTAGLENIATAKGDYDVVANFFKNVMSTTNDSDLLKYFNADELTRNIDENQQQLSEFGVRGGRRAAVLGQSYFDRDSAINKAIQDLRGAAPTQLAQIAQAIGNLGLGELSASTGAGAAASQNIFGVEGLRQADKDRRAQLISSIFQAIGGAAGAFFGSR